MLEVVTTWTMTRHARVEAAERTITDVEIANVIAHPEIDVASAEDPRLRYVGRAGVYLVIDPKVHSIVAVDGQKARGHHVAADPPVKIRRRPVRDRPHPSVPAALPARPTSPPPPELVFAAPLLPVPVPPVPVPPVVEEGPQVPEPPRAKLKPGPDPRPAPDLPSVLKGTLAPRKGPAPGPRPAPPSRPRGAVPPVDKLAGVHPGIAAGVRAELKKRGLDESRVVVLSPTNVEIR